MKYLKYIVPSLVVGLLLGIFIPKFIGPSNAGSQASAEHKHPVANADEESIYTCSMHPKVRQNEPGICPICEMDLIPLDTDMSSDDPTVLQMTKDAVRLAQIETFIVGGNSAQGLKGSSRMIKVDGTIELDERSFKSQTAHVEGRMESMLVSYEGEYVRVGQKIGVIYSTDLLAASQELITASKYDDKVAGLKAASIQKLKNWKISDAQIDKILESGKPIETIDIYADQSGYVMEKLVSQGNYVKQGQVLYTVGKTARLWLIFNVFESDLGSIAVGQNVSFTTPSTGSKEFFAKISFIDPLLNSSSRTGVVRAEINNSKNTLKPGMLLNGSIIVDANTGNKSGSLMVPSTAIMWTGNKSVLYVKLPDTEIPSYQFREVEIGSQTGGQIMVLSGLQAGEEVVRQGAFVIDAAAQLSNKSSMMNKDVQIKKNADTGVPDFSQDTPESFKKQLNQLANSYIVLKDALVETDPIQASQAVTSYLKSLEGIEMSLVEGDAHIYWMELLNSLKTHGEKIADLADVEDQRKQFGFVSEALIDALTAFGTSGTALYVQHCPMAFDNVGADWIASEEAIQNPYFGDKMMKCGLVKKTFEGD